ncbi:TetR/AcrR family transcriptional regulator [Curvibacter sp. APW13]|uniref:TetR/AcrR family transcriptional regulator n=1 Tax=Curvibacter sp. APW13 TaxID=3077236 RepID=UPI0028DDCC0D|nr:TetR/AcrR family transcriptional regulator [Curvibacter sp. APW13]MDT8989368.1 TetR/AcrR family transcriptional regulator [Curvibacter sp. APW13]
MNDIDHRTRVAAEKREKMRRKLVECAMVVFSRKGVEAAVVDEVIALAEVSRGTFYNYFKSNEELLVAVVQEMGHELFWLIEQVVGTTKNPLERVCAALRLTMHTARRYPRFGNFFLRSNVAVTPSSSLAHQFLERDIGEAMHLGKLKGADKMDVAIDFIVGATLGGVQSLLTRNDHNDSYPEEIAFHILLGLGVTVAAARRMVDLPLRYIDIPPNSLLERSNSLASE